MIVQFCLNFNLSKKGNGFWILKQCCRFIVILYQREENILQEINLLLLRLKLPKV